MVDDDALDSRSSGQCKLPNSAGERAPKRVRFCSQQHEDGREEQLIFFSLAAISFYLRKEVERIRRQRAENKKRGETTDT